MKNILFFLLTLFFVPDLASAQGYVIARNGKQLETLKANGIKVLITDDAFGATLKATVQELWTASEVEFISETDLAQYEDKQEAFVLGHFKGQFETPKKTLVNVPFIGIINRYRSEKNYKANEQSVSIVYEVGGVAEENLESAVRLYVKTLQSMVNSGGLTRFSATVKKGAAQARTQTAFVCEDHLDAAVADIKKKYSGKINVLDRAAFNQHILSEDPGLVSLDVRASNFHFFALISNQTGDMATMMYSTTIVAQTAQKVQIAAFKRLANW